MSSILSFHSYDAIYLMPTGDLDLISNSSSSRVRNCSNSFVQVKVNINSKAYECMLVFFPLCEL